MEKYKGSVLLRVLLSVGLIFFVMNSVFFYIDNPNNTILTLFIIGLLVQFFIGSAVIILKLAKKAYQFFLALIFIGWSVLNCAISFFLPFDENVWWPMYLILVSIFLLLSGIWKYRKIKFGYIMPALTLFTMGIVFSLFSFDIVKVPFKTVAIILGPIFAVLIGLALILFFLLQQRHKEFIVIDEDSGDFGDEELSFPKID